MCVKFGGPSGGLLFVLPPCWLFSFSIISPPQFCPCRTLCFVHYCSIPFHSTFFLSFSVQCVWSGLSICGMMNSFLLPSIALPPTPPHLISRIRTIGDDFYSVMVLHRFSSWAFSLILIFLYSCDVFQSSFSSLFNSTFSFISTQLISPVL